MKSRFVIGDPVWRELPIRADLQKQYEKCWQTAVSTILENNFDIATMDKDSGHIRTAWNEGVVTIGGSWYYRVQVSVKFGVTPGETKADGTKTPAEVSKIRLQVAGELTETRRGSYNDEHAAAIQPFVDALFA